jgi:cation diffusion facilitator CzcD-associated flavoprotein CzcO
MRNQESPDRVDAAVVGAGPYGLSVAAHLSGLGLHVATFGKPLELWRTRMPRGMLLRSHAWASNLSDPDDRHTFAAFFADSPTWKHSYPVPIQAFIDYGDWFRERAVPLVDETYVEAITRRGPGFELTLADGRTVRAATVVMAIGVGYYPVRPAEFVLPETQISHSADHADLARFAGQRVIVVGAGQSAIESAALLREAGAEPHVVCRRPILWLDPDLGPERPLLDRVLAPDAMIAPGWRNLVLDRLPYLFQRLPQPRKDRAIVNYYASAAADWLRHRVIGQVALHEHTRLERLTPTGEHFDAALSDGTTLRADHLLLCTGYRVDLARLPMLGDLRRQLATDHGIPALDPWFQSSIPGLYFTGLTSLRTFGPLYRFVAGARATARRIAAGVARRQERRAA